MRDLPASDVMELAGEDAAAAAASDVMELDGGPISQSHDNSRSLYLCFETVLEGLKPKVLCDLHVVKLADLICDQCSSGRPSSCQRNCSSVSESELKLDSPWKSMGGFRDFGCAVYKSKIVVAGGQMMIVTKRCKTCVPVRNVVTLDTDNKPAPPPLPLGFRSFTVGKLQPIMVEAGGKLYALPGPPLEDMHPADFDQSFEVYDPEHEEWCPLPEPPYATAYIQMVQGLPAGFCVAVVGTLILVSCINKRFVAYSNEVFCFNTETKKWDNFKIDSDYLDADVHPLPCDGKNLVLQDLMFAYPHDGKVTSFRVYERDSKFHFKPLLPPLDVLGGQFPSDFDSEEHELIYLGGQRVCLVLKTDWTEQGSDHEWRVAVIIFEYEFSTADGSDSLDCKVLARRLFRAKRIHMCSPTALRAAFVL